MDFINKKINEVYQGNIGDGLFKKQLMKLNQEQKKNSNAEFNQIFMYKTFLKLNKNKLLYPLLILIKLKN